MKKIIIGLTVFLGLASPAFAQQAMTPVPPAMMPAPQTTDAAPVDPEKLAAARTMIETMHSEQYVGQLMREFWTTWGGAVMRDNAEKKDAAKQLIEDDLLPIFKSHMHEIQENNAVVYARLFSLAELKDITNFYQGPTGQKLLQTMPQIFAETMQANRPLMMNIMSEATTKLKDDLRKNKLTVPKEMGV